MFLDVDKLMTIRTGIVDLQGRFFPRVAEFKKRAVFGHSQTRTNVRSDRILHGSWAFLWVGEDQQDLRILLPKWFGAAVS
jgi:hypothetical protein